MQSEQSKGSNDGNCLSGSNICLFNDLITFAHFYGKSFIFIFFYSLRFSFFITVYFSKFLVSSLVYSQHKANNM